MNKSLWNVDTTHSGIHFSVRHMVFAKVRGRFGSFSGTLEGDEKDLTRARVTAEIDAASVDTGTPDRDNHLRSADFFDAERFPKLRFTSTRIESLGGDRYRLFGDLTIRDLTREVALDVESGGLAKDPWGNLRAAFSLRTSIDRRDFGLTWNQMLEAGGVLVGERVDVEIEIQAVRVAEKERVAAASSSAQ